MAHDETEEFLSDLEKKISDFVSEVEFDDISQFANLLTGAITDAFDSAGDALEEENYHDAAAEAREVADKFRMFSPHEED
jgi:hypothetical protein